jgi:hypothetical protein
VRAAEDGATGRYVLAPGVREEFGPEAIGGMADLVAFFNAPWPPAAGQATVASGADGIVILVLVVAVAVGLSGVVASRLRRGRAAGPPQWRPTSGTR